MTHRHAGTGELLVWWVCRGGGPAWGRRPARTSGRAHTWSSVMPR